MSRILFLTSVAFLSSTMSTTSTILGSGCEGVCDTNTSSMDERGEAILYSLSSSNPIFTNKPYVDGSKMMYAGKIIDYSGTVDEVTSPIINSETGDKIVIGKIASLSVDEAIEIAQAAKIAWANGQGEWPQMSIEERIEVVMKFVQKLREKRTEIINVLMWEICKNTADAAAEFDRTMIFIESLVKALREMQLKDDIAQTVAGITARIRRAAIGVLLALGPFNYPFNETYTTIIPALLMGNVIIMKIPGIGGLAHVLTMEAFASCFPPGVVNFVSGSGRVTMGPIMAAGVDIFAFIGGSKAADILLKTHPNPHRLKVFLSLEGKNLGVVTDDADLDVAVEQCMIGTTTYNGQRCTAIKLIFVHSSIVKPFLSKLSESIVKLKAGLPWEAGVSITPLPEHNKVEYLNGLIQDATMKGATVVNGDKGGGQVYGNIMKPAIVYPVTSSMRLWDEEQFGPVIPVAEYNDISEIFQYISNTRYGQQAAIFTSNATNAAPLIDLLSTAVGRINLNTQCGRSPDVFPFSGRRSSSLGTISVTEALKTFSIETVLAYKSNAINNEVVDECKNKSKFLAPISQT